MTAEKKDRNPGFDVATAPLLVPTLLEASAGTGKTFSIKHLVLRFIVEAGIPINHLLVMTFTRAATAELKARIESHLTEALGVLTGTIAHADADALTVKQIGLWRGMGIDDRDAEDRIRESLALFDNAGIFTIHSFCQKVIEDNAFSSGGTINFDLTDSDDKFRSDAVRDFLRRSLDAMPEEADRRELVDGDNWDKKLQNLADYPESLVPRRWTDFNNLSPEIQKAVSTFMTDVPGRLLDMKKNARVKTFNDLLRELYDRLLPGAYASEDVMRQAERLAKRVRSAYRGVLIDEFQDTDPIQYAIVEKLFLSVYDAKASPDVQAEREGRAIFFVGDPKQAIYRFRSADLNTYLRARKRIAEIGRTEALMTNFRSSPKLVDAFNAFWTTAPTGLPFLRAGLAYQTVHSSSSKTGLWMRDGDDWKEPLPLEIWTEAGGSLCANADDVRTSSMAALGLSIAKLISAGLRGDAVIAAEAGETPIGGLDLSPRGGPASVRGVEARDIAVLVRTNSEALLVKDALAERGVRVRYQMKESVAQTEEASEMILLLRAFAAPGDMRAMNAARATRLVGDTLQTLQTDEKDEARRVELRRVLEEGLRRWPSSGPAPAVRRLMALCRTTERLLPCEDGERRLVNYAHLLELLHAAHRTVPTPVGLAEWLENQKTSGGSAEDQKVRLESDANLVTLQTIHSSKGLQYPIVYLPFAQKKLPGGSKSSVHLVPDDEGRLNLLLSHVASDADEREVSESIEEDVRLAYVAMTRAAKHLVVMLPQSMMSKKSPDSWGANTSKNAYFAALCGGTDKKTLTEVQARKRLESLRNTGTVAVRDFSLLAEAGKADGFQVSSETKPSDFDVEKARDVRGGWRTSSFTGISRMTEDECSGFPVWYGEAEKVPVAGDILAFPKGAQAGTCLHEMLELADFAGMAPDTEEARAARLELCSREVEKHLSFADDAARELAAEGAARMIYDILNAEIAPGLFLRDVPKRARSAELEFLIPIPKGLTAERLANELRELDPEKYDFGGLRPESLQGFLTGFIDLAFMHDGRFYVLDWKSNKISPEADGYEEKAMDEEMRRHLYRLQYLIYLVALRRFLRSRLGEHFHDDMIGGAIYVFLRGVRADATTPDHPQGIVFDPVRPAVIRRLDQLFAGEC